LKLPDSCSGVALFAGYRRVRAKKREAVLMIFNLLRCDFPTEDSVATGAIRSHFALMDVGMAVLAILAHIGKDRLHVALRALHFFMQAAQGVFRLAVVKLKDFADRPPSSGGVAIFARNVESTVRTSSVPFLGLACGSKGGKRKCKSEPTNRSEEL